MITIPVEFLPFGETHIGDLFGSNGIYVIWDAHAKARPTYVGEGNVLVRLGYHAKNDVRTFARPLDGYIALIDDVKRRGSKTITGAVERLLLDVADETDYAPVHNRHPGAGALVKLLCAEQVLNIAVKGYDPFCHPATARPLQRTKNIKAWMTADGDYEIDHDWRLRRLRAPIV